AAELINVAKSFYDDKVGTVATHRGSTMPTKTGVFQPPQKNPSTTVNIDRFAYRELVGTWRNKQGGEIQIKEEDAALSARHTVPAGTLSEYGVRPNAMFFMSGLPLRG